MVEAALVAIKLFDQTGWKEAADQSGSKGTTDSDSESVMNMLFRVVVDCRRVSGVLYVFIEGLSSDILKFIDPDDDVVLSEYQKHAIMALQEWMRRLSHNEFSEGSDQPDEHDGMSQHVSNMESLKRYKTLNNLRFE